MFRNIGWGEILIVVAVVMLLFGAGKLPHMAQSLGRSITGFKKGLRDTAEDVKDALKEETTAEPDAATKSDSASIDTTKTGQE